MGLQSNIHSEPVARLPLREGIIVGADATVGSVMERMRQRQLGCAIVVDPDGRPLGTFSERAIIELLLQRPNDQFEQVQVGQAMDETWFQVRSSEPIVAVLDLIQQQDARFVCVVDEQGRAIGLTGQKGLSEYIADHYPQQVMIQRVGGRPGQQAREGA